jgi:hypothetical protein
MRRLFLKPFISFPGSFYLLALPIAIRRKATGTGRDVAEAFKRNDEE